MATYLRQVHQTENRKTIQNLDCLTRESRSSKMDSISATQVILGDKSYISFGATPLTFTIYRLERPPKGAIGLPDSFTFHRLFAVTVALFCVAIVSCVNPASAQLEDSGGISSTSSSSATLQSQAAREVLSSQALDLVREWSSRFGRDIHYGTQEATCLRPIRDQFDPSKNDSGRRGEYRASVVSNDWTRMHAEIVQTISNTMGWHKTAVESIARASEQFAGNHTYDKKLHWEYVDVHRLHNIDEEEPIYGTDLSEGLEGNNNSSLSPPLNGEDFLDPEINQSDAKVQDARPGETDPLPEPLPTPSKLQSSSSNSTTQQMLSDLNNVGPQGEWQTPVKYLRLSKHRNFDDVLINTEESAVHIPVHIFPGDAPVMNGIAWSDQLTKVFRDNFVRNPKLTNQYFASQYGFMRLFPAQKWQIARTDPDLYDARMRPWYVAGASSRKDVVILVDSSGSMTGSRRDIAKGVVFEILDTLTDNDHFLILKFSDFIQQVGVPGCTKMRVERKGSSVPLKNTLFQQTADQKGLNETDIESLYLLPATGRNIRHVKTNFTIPTSGIANFSHALVTAFEVLRNYQDSETLGSQCNQAIMLITDGSPSDFEDVFRRYNYPNAPIRMFTYLIGREAGDVTHTKMIACHNRGYYTHVINLAEVRETVQQYIPVMARPLVLNGTHPVTWTPAYGELTYQLLTDWIWESKRRDKARAILAANGRGASYNQPTSYVPDIRVTSDDGSGYSLDEEGNEASLEEELEAIDLFGYASNTDCFWQTHRNDLLTTVVQPVYDRNNQSVVVEKFLVKNVWTTKETIMRTAQILGVAAADMKINDIVALAPSHKLGPNGYAIMLTNNGFAMHHPDLRSILEPLSMDPAEKNMRILKPYFSSIDFTQVEHILNPEADSEFTELRKEAVSGLTGWRELHTKRTLDCQKRVQSRKQSFYFKPIQQFPFSFMIAIPQPYGSHRVKAQVEIKNSALPEKLTTYFTTSDYDIWTVHPDYQYCDGPSNNTVTTLLDMFQRVETLKLDDIQWRPAESSKPPLFLPGKIVCDKDLVQSLVYDAVATFGFSETCGPPSDDTESSLLGLFGVRFSFVATRSGLTRIRHYVDEPSVKREALAFAKKHARAVDETFYSRTVDYNMLVNDSSTLIQVPFNTFEKIRDRLQRYENPLLNMYDSTDGSLAQDGSTNMDELDRRRLMDMNIMEKLEILANKSLHVVATQSIVVNEGAQQAVAGVAGVFYDYASFVIRFFNSTHRGFHEGAPMTKPATCYTGNSEDESCDDSKALKCGFSNDTIDCLLIDNNGYIIVSEHLDYIGRHIKAYEPQILTRLLNAGVFHEVNITDYQSICMRQEEKQPTSDAISSIFRPGRMAATLGTLVSNLAAILTYTWTIFATSANLLSELTLSQTVPLTKQQLAAQPMLALLPNKTYLRPCEKRLTLYETRGDKFGPSSVETYTSRCGCSNSWFVYEQVPKTNLLLLIVDTTDACRQDCLVPSSQQFDPLDPLDAKYANTEEQVCSMLERESQLYRKKLDACISHHPDEEQIKLCGAGTRVDPVSKTIIISAAIISSFWYYFSLKLLEG